MFATENEGQAWLEDSKLEAADPRPNKTRFQLNTARWFPKCYKKSDRSQDARRWSPDMPN